MEINFVTAYILEVYRVNMLYIALICRVAQKVIRELANKKKVDIQYVDKTALERLSGNKPHQVGNLR